MPIITTQEEAQRVVNAFLAREEYQGPVYRVKKESGNISLISREGNFGTTNVFFERWDSQNVINERQAWLGAGSDDNEILSILPLLPTLRVGKWTDCLHKINI